MQMNIFSMLFNQNKRKMKMHYSRCLSIKQALIGAAYFCKQLDVFNIVLYRSIPRDSIYSYIFCCGGKCKQ